MTSDGTITAELPNPAVSHELLQKIWSWTQNGVSLEDAIDRIRPCTVPTGYPFNTWRPGKYKLLKQQF